MFYRVYHRLCPRPLPPGFPIESDYVMIGIGVVLSVGIFLGFATQKIPLYHSKTDNDEANPMKIFYYRY